MRRVKPLDQWRGAFGDAYTDRNKPQWERRSFAWRSMLRDVRPRSVLEVGCNRGANLIAIRQLLPKAQLVGIEPNAHAREEAQRDPQLRSMIVIDGSATQTGFKDGGFDLVFTAGVLIHIPPEELDAALAELYRVSTRWLLAIEYHAMKETAIEYRGQAGLLWKRDYPMEYLHRFPTLAVRRSGLWTPRHGFDHCCWWLMEQS